jgi:O-antigen ligase
VNVTEKTVGEPRTGGVPVVLVMALTVVTLLGRFTLDRIGFVQLGDLDLRILAIPGLLLVTLLWRVLPGPARYRHRWPASVRLTLVLIGYLCVTVFWAPLGARVSASVFDLACLAALVVLTGTIAAPDPARARRLMLLCLFGAGLAYGLAGLLVGQTNAQGRTAAFGGGPNVYVRVVALGIIAAIALAVIYRRRWLLLSVPPLLVAGALAGSRGGTLAAAVTALVIALLVRRRMSGRSWLFAGVLAVAAAGAAALLLPRSAMAGLQSRFVSQIFVQDQYSGRPELIDQGLTLALGHPVWGAGLDSFYATVGGTEDLGYPHNLVVDIAASSGVIGLGLLVAVGVAFLRDGRPWRSMAADRVALVAAALYVAVASMFSGDMYDSRFMWIFIALAMVGSAESRSAARSPAVEAPDPRVPAQAR